MQRILTSLAGWLLESETARDRRSCPWAEVQTPAPGPCSVSGGRILGKLVPPGPCFHVCKTGWQYMVPKFGIVIPPGNDLSNAPSTGEGPPWTRPWPVHTC